MRVIADDAKRVSEPTTTQRRQIFCVEEHKRHYIMKPDYRSVSLATTAELLRSSSVNNFAILDDETSSAF